MMKSRNMRWAELVAGTGWHYVFIWMKSFSRETWRVERAFFKNRRTGKWEDIEETGFEDVNYVYVAQEGSSGGKL
jgi:hypothetical protein